MDPPPPFPVAVASLIPAIIDPEVPPLPRLVATALWDAAASVWQALAPPPVATARASKAAADAGPYHGRYFGKKGAPKQAPIHLRQAAGARATLSATPDPLFWFYVQP